MKKYLFKEAKAKRSPKRTCSVGVNTQEKVNIVRVDDNGTVHYSNGETMPF